MPIEGYRIYLLLIILTSCIVNSFSQEDSTFIAEHEITEKVTDTVTPSKTGNRSFYITSVLGDNLVIASSVSHKQLYYTSSLYYSFRSSFYLGASAYHFPGYNRVPTLNSVYSGYYHDFFSFIDVNLGLYGYIVPESLQASLFESFINTDLKVGFDWNLIYTEISASWIPGEGSSSFYNVKNSKYFQLPLTGKKSQVSFQPYADLVFGSMVKITIGGNTYTGIRSSTARWSSKSFRDEIFTGENEDSDQQGNGPGTNSGGTGTGSSSEDEGVPGADGNNSIPGGQPSQSDDQQSPGSNDNSFPDQGSQNGPDTGYQQGSQTEPQPGSPAGSESGSPDGTSAGSQSGSSNETQPGTGQQGGTESGQGTQPGSPATDPGNNSGSGYDKAGPGKGSKGDRISEESGNIPANEWSINDFFGLMEIEVGLPVSFTKGRFIFEIEPGYVKTMYNDPYIPRPGGFTFMFSIYLRVF